MENQIQVFTHEETFRHDQFGDLRVRYDDRHNIEINLEDAARGLGFVHVQTISGKTYSHVRWETVYRYLEDIGFCKFQTWIADAITSVRKHGFYVTPNAKITPDFLRQLAGTLEAKNAKIAAQEIQIAELTQKADYYDKVLNCGGLLTTTELLRIIA